MPANTTHTIALGSGTTTIANFKGIGRGVNPTAAVLADADTLKFIGSGLTVDKLQLLQIGNDVVVTFEGVSSVKVILQNIKLDELENMTKAGGAAVDFATMLFDGDTTIKDSFDVVDSDRQISTIYNPNTVTFLNDLNNTINGKDSSNDIIHGLGGNDILYGLTGDDVLYGDDGDDTLYGGLGNDHLIGGVGNNKLDGGDGIDIADYQGLAQGITVHYTSFGNWKVATSGTVDQLTSIEKVQASSNLTNVIDFSKVVVDFSSQTIDLKQGSITTSKMQSGVINPIVNQLTLEGSFVKVIGSQAADKIYSSDRDSVIDGGAGNDVIYGGTGKDSIIGGIGDDTIDGGDGDDSLLGGDGIDIISGGIGNDSIYGEAGDDQITGGLGTNRLDGGAGIDTAIYLGTAYPITPPLTFRYNSSSVWNVVTSGVNDQLVNFEKVSIVNFSSSKTSIDMSGYYNSQGPLQVNVNSGKVVVTIPGLQGGSMEFSSPNNAGLLQSLYGLSVTGSRFNDYLSSTDSGIKLFGGRGKDTINGGVGSTLFGGGDDDTITGGDNSSLYGDDGNDVLYGGNGNEALYGGAGNDILNGGLGSDILNGGDGIDTVSYSSLSTPITLKYNSLSSWNIWGNEIKGQLIDVEKLSVSSFSKLTVDMSSYNASTSQGIKVSSQNSSGIYTTIEVATNPDRFVSPFTIISPLLPSSTVAGNGSRPGLVFTGSRLNDNLSLGRVKNAHLYGGEGNDRLTGGDGAIVYGDEGNDILDGGVNSTLYGGDGNDILYAGYGGGVGDVMIGGTGADIFDFLYFYDQQGTVFAHTIRDFNRYEGDKITLLAKGLINAPGAFNALSGEQRGPLNSSLFSIRGSGVSQTILTYDIEAGDLYYNDRAYTIGSATPVPGSVPGLGYKIMHLDGGVVLQSSDFLIRDSSGF